MGLQTQGDSKKNQLVQTEKLKSACLALSISEAFLGTWEMPGEETSLFLLCEHFPLLHKRDIVLH